MKKLVPLVMVLLAAMVASNPVDAKKSRPIKKAAASHAAQLQRADAHASMVRQNEQADLFGLPRFEKADMGVAQQQGLLVRLPRPTYVRASTLMEYHWISPCAREFIVTHAQEFSSRFRNYWQINSAFRPKEYQAHLERTLPKGQAGTAERGPRQSTHLTGWTFDLSKANMRPAHMRWLRAQLARLLVEGHIEVIPEREVFHIMVLPRYCGHLPQAAAEVPPVQVSVAE